MMVIENEFELQQVVYLKTDPDQYARIVLGIEVCPYGDLLYRLQQGSNSSQHYGLEISAEKDLCMDNK